MCVCRTVALCVLLQGFDLIWESVGGDMFTTCSRALAHGGRLVVIGMMSQYTDGWAPSKVCLPSVPPHVIPCNTPMPTRMVMYG